ncbi:hypothetical protein CYMTET_8855 [Cymbomonas tetramitiformis]|uniref:Uncharacterized protein n=1 Tax=Cymbomonas tetramitiformis TaxID=36881 RepID=A0AAE0GS66_9CHLO|nr:hypothetical protein CYMTET_8855 [Cymbomonas tetramitiformis]
MRAGLLFFNSFYLTMATELRRTRSARQQSEPEPDRASPPPRPRSRGRAGGDTLWLVRGGPGHGSYRIFAAAIDAGYYDRMPENAIKLVGDECAFADEWLGRPPKKTGRWAAFKKGVKRSNPFVKWLLVSIIVTAFLSAVYVIVVSVDEWLSCKTLWNGSNMVCSQIKKIESLVSENMTIFVAGVIGVELAGLIVWFLTTLVNLLFGQD